MIQAAWRVYASMPGSSCTATWNIYLHVGDPNQSTHNKSFSSNNQSFGGSIKSTNSKYIFAWYIFIIEKTAEKLRYLRLSTSVRKARSKRNSQASQAGFLQSPTSDNRNSNSSTSNTTGNNRKFILL